MREAGRVEHHLLDGDHVLAFGAELRDVLGDAAGRVDRAVADEDPHALATTGFVAEKMT